MNEFKLLKHIYAASKDSNKSITIGPGDDMGEILLDSSRLLCAVDQLIVGRHVTSDAPPELIGRKAVARCFSDIAAMAGTPLASLMTACLPSDTEDSWALAVFEGARKAAGEWGAPIMGGDIASCQNAPPMFTVTALATPSPSGALRRTGAQEGDYVCVTGELGNSLESHHLTFSPRINEAQELLQELGSDVHCMIDISDGLGQDASHLADVHLQLVIDTTSLPLRIGATIQNALSDGEDYELLFTSASVPCHPLVTVIGEVTKRNANAPSVIDEIGNDISSMGWTH